MKSILWPFVAVMLMLSFLNSTCNATSYQNTYPSSYARRVVILNQVRVPSQQRVSAGYGRTKVIRNYQWVTVSRSVKNR